MKKILKITAIAFLSLAIAWVCLMIYERPIFLHGKNILVIGNGYVLKTFEGHDYYIYFVESDSTIAVNSDNGQMIIYFKNHPLKIWGTSFYVLYRNLEHGGDKARMDLSHEGYPKRRA